MTTQQHNQLLLASEIRIETTETGSGHWELKGYFSTDDGEVVIRKSTTDSELVCALNDKNENTERIEEATQIAISQLINYGTILQ